MCGIAGYVDFQKPPPHEILLQMERSLAHRGPDEGNVWSDAHCGLAHRRLRVIDLSPAAAQPMTNEDGNLVVVFNGEIYNFQTLRAQLEQLGHTFRSHSDTEILLHGYESWGDALFEKLSGMFAFAIWDRIARRLVFGRDAFGLNSYSGTWLSNVLFSAQRVGQGFLLAVAVGVPLGVLIGWSPLAARLVDPTVQALRPVPITAWLPFCIAIFGIRAFGAIFLIALGAFYPIVINSAHGARDVGRNLVRAAAMMGASPLQLLLRVVLPAALPAVFTGLRIGLGTAWTAVIVAEMVAVKSGLGYVLWDAYYIGRMDVVIADMVSIGLAGFLSDQVILLIEHRLLRWRQLTRG